MQGPGQTATPLLELEYWSARAADLSGLVAQLGGAGRWRGVCPAQGGQLYLLSRP